MATRLERLGARRIDASVPSAKLLNESWRSINQSESVRYVIGSMQPIDAEYTRNTYLQGERVKNQLEKVLNPPCAYEYQGSTTNDTHIKAASDIDLLVLTGKFWGLERPQVAKVPYAGDPIQDLAALRSEVEKLLRSAFHAATIDATGSKSISIMGGSLTRKVDVVPANWLQTLKYVETGQSFYRGVEIFDSRARLRIANTPFLHNAYVEGRDSETQGGLRKAARLMKSLKYDLENIGLSSYDIVSIAYNIPAAWLQVQKGQELLILAACQQYVSSLSQNQVLRESISVPDGHRRVFDAGHATIAGLEQLRSELEKLATDVLRENQRSFRKLAEARIAY